MVIIRWYFGESLKSESCNSILFRRLQELFIIAKILFADPSQGVIQYPRGQEGVVGRWLVEGPRLILWTKGRHLVSKMSTIVHGRGVGGQNCPRWYWMTPNGNEDWWNAKIEPMYLDWSLWVEARSDRKKIRVQKKGRKTAACSFIASSSEKPLCSAQRLAVIFLKMHSHLPSPCLFLGCPKQHLLKFF